MTKRAKTYKINTPAKINIGLRVLSKRRDGFHNIETIFYPLKIHDRIMLTISKLDSAKQTKIYVRTSGPRTLKFLQNENNICYKAAKLFLDKFKIKENYRISIWIKKNIPIGAGLGGGSSNAAAVLKTLAKHFKKTDNSAVKNLALELGSDVPFFLYGKPAYATGRGDILKPLPKFKVNFKICTENPGIHVSTLWAYKQLKRQKAKGKKLSRIKNFNKNNKDKFVNDFEKVVIKKFPAISKLKQKMYDEGAVFASMSGSGSTVYGFFRNKKQ